MAKYTAPQGALWEGRKSSGKDYLHELVRLLDLDDNPGEKIRRGDYAILGYNCDEGVRRNNGRPGAVNGYTAIVKQLAGLPGHHNPLISIFDCGAVLCDDRGMEQAQEELSKRVSQLMLLGARPILLGGGHDIALGHYRGLRPINPGIINIDAHFDLRTPAPDGNSGTPFYQIAEDLKNDSLPFRYLVMGIRSDGNAKSLFDAATRLDVEIIPVQDLNRDYHKDIRLKIIRFMEELDAIYLTIDLDVFSSAYAPGVSAASPFGITPDTGCYLIDQVLKSGKVCSVDLAEMNPAFDRDAQTAKLAAGLVSYIMQKWPYSNQDL